MSSATTSESHMSPALSRPAACQLDDTHHAHANIAMLGDCVRMNSGHKCESCMGDPLHLLILDTTAKPGYPAEIEE